MGNMLHSKPRFGLDPETGLIYDYVTQRDVHPQHARGAYISADGKAWDLDKVREAILSGGNVEDACVGAQSVAPNPPQSAGADAPPPAGAFAGLSATALRDLGLSALQAAAMGFGPVEFTNGVTPEKIAALGLNPARIKALELSDEQVSALCAVKSD